MDQTQTQPQAGPTLGTNSQIDPTALALSRSIRQVESNGNYNAVGDNGQSHGAYQFNKNNFKSWATEQGLDPNDMSEQNQDHVAYNRIKSDLDSGLSQSEVAAKWNGAKLVNGHYQAINPGYVEKVKQAYSQHSSNPATNGLGALTPQPQTQSGPTTLPQGQQATPPPPGPNILTQLGQGDIMGAAKTAGNFAFPIVGDLLHDIQGKNDKSVLQQVGDAGMSALWFLPFGDIAEGLGVGAKALGLGEAAAKATGVIGAGLAGGYAGDVSSNLAQGQTGASALKPGMGTVAGGTLAGAGLGIGKLYNKFVGEKNVVNKVASAYEDGFGATKSGIKGASKTAARGLDPNAEFLANAGIPPETEEVNGRRVWTTGADSASQKTLQSRVTALTNLRDEGIQKSGATTNFEKMRQQMLDQASKEFSGKQMEAAQAHINNEMDSISKDPKYPQDENGNISLSDASKIKSYFQGNANYDATRPSFISQTNGTAAKIAKGVVESDAEGAGSPSVKAINKIIQQHLDAMDALSKLNGQVVKGGRLGTYVNRGIGAAIGEGASQSLGGGLLGNIAGPILGAKAGDYVSQFLQKLAVGGPLSAGVLGRMASEDPEIVQKFLEYIGSNGEKVAPMMKPAQQSAGGLVSSFMKKRSPSAGVAGLIKLTK